MRYFNVYEGRGKEVVNCSPCLLYQERSNVSKFPEERFSLVFSKNFLEG